MQVCVCVGGWVEMGYYRIPTDNGKRESVLWLKYRKRSSSVATEAAGVTGTKCIWWNFGWVRFGCCGPVLTHLSASVWRESKCCRHLQKVYPEETIVWGQTGHCQPAAAEGEECECDRSSWTKHVSSEKTSVHLSLTQVFMDGPNTHLC